MLEHPHRGVDRGSVITRRVFTTSKSKGTGEMFLLGVVFYEFYFLEDARLLDKEKTVDFCTLHMAFLPLIQQQLHSFRYGWANHCLRTEHNNTPATLDHGTTVNE